MTTLIQRFLPRFSLQNYLFKRLKRESRIELTAKRIYILPTREGVFYGIVIFLLLSGAMNYNNSLLFIFTFLLASIGIISMYHTHNNLLHVVTRAVESAAVFSGEYLIIPVQLSLKKGQTKKRYSLVLEFFNDDERGTNLRKNKFHNNKTKKNKIQKNKYRKNKSNKDEESLNSSQKQFFDLDPTEKCIVNFHVKTIERGYLKSPRLTLSSRYPLGFLRAWSNFLFEQKYLVYPQPLSKTELDKIELSSEDGIGDKGKGHDEFIELREKQLSDAYTHVHWKAYARTGAMLVKQYGGAATQNVVLKWSDYPQYDTEKRLSLFTRILIEAYQQQQSFSLVLPNTSLPLETGHMHLHHCLKALALFPKGQDV